MGWKEIDDKLKRRRDALYVSCDEEWELDYLKDLKKNGDRQIMHL